MTTLRLHVVGFIVAGAFTAMAGAAGAAPVGAQTLAVQAENPVLVDQVQARRRPPAAAGARRGGGVPVARGGGRRGGGGRAVGAAAAVGIIGGVLGAIAAQQPDPYYDGPRRAYGPRCHYRETPYGPERVCYR